MTMHTKLNLPKHLSPIVEQAFVHWDSTDGTQRLWQRDPTLWANQDEDQWMGWLPPIDQANDFADCIAKVSDDIDALGDLSTVKHIVLLGTGGSSRCVRLFDAVFSNRQPTRTLDIICETDTKLVNQLLASRNLAETLFIVSSKSGKSLEIECLRLFFSKLVRDALGDQHWSQQFIAITDPGSPLANIAGDQNYRGVIFTEPTIGGRYSALSATGFVPALLLGLPVGQIAKTAAAMHQTCSQSLRASENPAVALGLTLAALSQSGQDKVTIVTSPNIGAMSDWLEQLLAESTGKNGKGLIPICNELIAAPELYKDDRVFVYLRLSSDSDMQQDQAIKALVDTDQTVIQITIDNKFAIGAEILRWEIAITAAGAAMAINPFDQPNVATEKFPLSEMNASEQHPPSKPIFEDDQLQIYMDGMIVDAIGDTNNSLESIFAQFFSQLETSSYFALLAFTPESQPNISALTAIRRIIRDKTNTATMVGFGPNYLHSTAQLFKGGNNQGLFLQITYDDDEDLDIPTIDGTFNQVRLAQAIRNYRQMIENDRRILRVHFCSPDHRTNLEKLNNIIIGSIS
ncbi:MAG: hypothetical protein HKM24_07695 [Gammaproteobacteria bacterium]|nr:hypothetical protein [Gammaproteobacteria bacterium]